MYNSPWKNFALYRKFGKFEITIQAASQHPILFRLIEQYYFRMFCLPNTLYIFTIYLESFLFSLF